MAERRNKATIEVPWAHNLLRVLETASTLVMEGWFVCSFSFVGTKLNEVN